MIGNNIEHPCYMYKTNKNTEGTLVWITGLPGTGKTTLGEKTYETIKVHVPSVFMDGDIFREIMGNDLRYSREDRKVNAFRIARMNKYLVKHGLTVICATVSLFKEVHAWNHKHINNLIEVFIEVPEPLLKKRDPKGFYAQKKLGTIQNVVGIDQVYDKPQKPHIIINNNGSLKDFLHHTHTITQLVLKQSVL